GPVDADVPARPGPGWVGRRDGRDPAAAGCGPRRGGDPVARTRTAAVRELASRLVARVTPVEVLTSPEPCPDPGCRAWQVRARERGTGRIHVVHRLPDRPVIPLTPPTTTGKDVA